MSRRRRSSARAQQEKFWGELEVPAEPPELIRPTTDPGAIPRSLGEPPLAPNPANALGQLTVVYEEAVRAATALAAINGLLAADE